MKSFIPSPIWSETVKYLDIRLISDRLRSISRTCPRRCCRHASVTLTMIVNLVFPSADRIASRNRYSPLISNSCCHKPAPCKLNHMDLCLVGSSITNKTYFCGKPVGIGSTCCLVNLTLSGKGSLEQYFPTRITAFSLCFGISGCRR